jgi:hypothetical protein
MRSYLSSRFLSSQWRAIAGRSITQTILCASLALCAGILTATAAYGASSKANTDSAKNHQGWEVGVIVPDGQAEVTGTWKVHPLVKTLLLAEVLYNPNNCGEYTPGNWVLESDPKYGNVYKGLVTGKLANGKCSKYRYTGDGVFYKWVVDIHATKDKFSERWYADGEYLPVTFDIILVK